MDIREIDNIEIKEVKRGRKKIGDGFNRVNYMKKYYKNNKQKFLKKPRKPKYKYTLKIMSGGDCKFKKIYYKMNDLSNELNIHRSTINLIIKKAYSKKYKEYIILKEINL